MHYDNSVVPGVGDDEVAHVIDGNPLGPHELSVAAALAAQNPSVGAIGMDHQDMMDVEVRDNDVAFVIEGNPTRRVKVPTKVALVAKLPQEDAIMAEDKESVIARVSDCNPPVQLVHSNVIRIDHLTVIATLRSKHEQEGPIDLQHLDSVVVLVGYHYMPFSRHRHSSWTVELPRSDSFPAKFVFEGPIDIKDLNAVVAPVSNNDISLLVSADSPRTTKLPIL